MINPVVLLLIQIITQCLSFRNLFSYKYIQDRFFDERILSEPNIFITFICIIQKHPLRRL